MKPLEQALLEAAKQSSDAVRALAEVEATRVPPAKIENKNVPEEFKRSVSLEWSAGAVAPAVKVIADQLNYKFIETGAKPAVAITVDIHAKDKPIYLILEDIGWQVGKRADVVVNTDHRTVEVRYAPQR